MGRFDVVAGVCTGGLYTAGKAIYQAGNAAEDAGNAAEQAGLALAVIGSTIESLGEQLNSFLQETEELITIQRLSPRDTDELWDEEKERLAELQQEKQQLKIQLKELGIEDTENFNFDFWDLVTDVDNVLKQFQLVAGIASINKEINEILYQEPGVLATGIYNAKEVLERLNTIEQPLIEEILTSVDDNLEISEEVLKEVQKLFVTKEKVSVPLTELSPDSKFQLDFIEKDISYYHDLIQRKENISSGMINVMKEMPIKKFEIKDSTINIEGMGNSILIPEKAIPDAARDLVKEKLRENEFALENTRLNRETAARNLEATENARDVIRPEEPEARSFQNLHPAATSGMHFSIDKIAKVSPDALQPHGAKISASIATKFDGFQRNYDLLRAQSSYYNHQLLKLDRKKLKLTNTWVEKPGVVPQTLDDLHGILENVRTEHQPRIDTVLDSLNENLVESKSTLAKANDTMESVQSALSILNFNTKYVKYGAMAIGGLIVLNLFVGLIVLTRAAFGI